MNLLGCIWRKVDRMVILSPAVANTHQLSQISLKGLTMSAVVIPPMKRYSTLLVEVHRHNQNR